MGEWVSGWVGELVSGWVSGWVGEWVNEWVSGWVSKWVREWVSEWESERVRVSEWVGDWDIPQSPSSSRQQWFQFLPIESSVSLSQLEVHRPTRLQPSKHWLRRRILPSLVYIPCWHWQYSCPRRTWRPVLIVRIRLPVRGRGSGIGFESHRVKEA